jgi:hypothetical protein
MPSTSRFGRCVSSAATPAGAAFAGLAGSIFAVMLTSVYPSGFQLVVSINVLALIIIGGMGSLPGVVLGSILLIGPPELLREFGEYRYLLYGAMLIVMMRPRATAKGKRPSHGRRKPGVYMITAWTSDIRGFWHGNSSSRRRVPYKNAISGRSFACTGSSR